MATLLLILAFVAVAALGLLAVFTREAGTRRRSVTVVCPVHGRPALVEFVLSETGPAGEAYGDVARCALSPGAAPVACEKVCRSVSVAPFGTLRLAAPVRPS